MSMQTHHSETQIYPSPDSVADEDHRRRITLACALIVIAVMVCDAFSVSVNFAIIYAVPLTLYGTVGRRRGVWTLTVVLIVLNFVGYLLPWSQWSDPKRFIFSYRLLNRAFTSGTLLVIGGMLHFWIGIMRIKSQRSPEQDADVVADEQVFEWWKGITARVLVGASAVSVGLTDFLTPNRLNLPILYGIPLIICGLTQRRRLMWLLLPVLLLMNGFAIFLGRANENGHGIISLIITNRLISAASLIVMTLILNLLISLREESR